MKARELLSADDGGDENPTGFGEGFDLVVKCFTACTATSGRHWRHACRHSLWMSRMKRMMILMTMTINRNYHEQNWT